MTKVTTPKDDKKTNRKQGVDALDRPLVKRFYDEVAAVEEGGNYHIRLDGKNVRTPAREKLCLPGHALAEKICDEWRTQTEFINPQTMPLTQLANTAIDGVSPKMGEVVEATLAYACSDLLCYRADGPDTLADLQRQDWDPVLNWLKMTYGAEFRTTNEISFIEQPATSITKIEARLQSYDPLVLSAVNVMTTLTGSVFLSVAVADEHLDVDAAWAAAHVDEDWQFSRWGGDAEAELRREKRFKDMKAAADFLHLSRQR